MMTMKKKRRRRRKISMFPSIWILCFQGKEMVTHCLYLVDEVLTWTLHSYNWYRDEENFPQKGDLVKVHYTAEIKDSGKVFENSRSRKRPFEFKLGGGSVIRGFDITVLHMSKGMRALVHIPPQWAYGEQGCLPLIPPNSTITYNIELISWHETAAPRAADMKIEKPELALEIINKKRQWKKEQVDSIMICTLGASTHSYVYGIVVPYFLLPRVVLY